MPPLTQPHDDRPTLAPSRLARWGSALGWAMLAVYAVFGLYASRFGLDLLDSGLYPSMGWRYTQGDLPFRDETFSSHFDLIYWLLFALLPDAGEIHFRFLGVAVEMASLACWFVLLKRFAPAPLVALAMAPVLYVSAGGLWVPGYDVFGTRFLHISLALWLLAALRQPGWQRHVLVGLSAFSFLLAVTCHPAMLPAALAPPMLAMLARRHGNAPDFTRTSLQWTGLVYGCLLLLAGGLWSSGLLGAEFNSFSASENLVSPIQRFHKFLYGIFRFLPNILVLTVTFGLLFRFTPKAPARSLMPPRPWTATAIILVGSLLALPQSAFWTSLVTEQYGHFIGTTEPLIPNVEQEFDDFFGQYWISVLALAGVAIAAIDWSRQKQDEDDSWSLLYLAITPTLLSVALLHALVSYLGFRTFVFALSPVVILSIIHCYRRLAGNAGSLQNKCAATIPVILLCVIFGYVQLSDRLHRFHGEAGRASLSATSPHPQLRGIYSSPERLALVENTVAAVTARTQPGDRILEFGAGPIFYYLTRTRPALSKTWCIPTYSDERQQRLLDRMLEVGHAPTLVLTSEVHPHVLGYNNDWTWADARGSEVSGPIPDYIRDHYTPTEHIGPLLLWERKPEH